MSKIKAIKAIEILDSRGNPTLQTEVFLESGMSAKAAVPSGASTGKYEAFELRDTEEKRYAGLGVEKAVANVNKKIAPLLKGFNPEKQAEIDQKMIALDNTETRNTWGPMPFFPFRWLPAGRPLLRRKSLCMSILPALTALKSRIIFRSR